MGVLGFALWSMFSKSLSLPSNSHIGGAIGAVIGFTIAWTYKDKRRKQRVKSKKIRSAKRPWFTEQEKESLTWIFIIAMIPFVIWIAVAYPYEVLKFLPVPISQAVIYWYQSTKRTSSRPDNSPPDMDFSRVPVSPKPSNPSLNREKELDKVISSSRKDENYSDIHRYLN